MQARPQHHAGVRCNCSPTSRKARRSPLPGAGLPGGHSRRLQAIALDWPPLSPSTTGICCGCTRAGRHRRLSAPSPPPQASFVASRAPAAAAMPSAAVVNTLGAIGGARGFSGAVGRQRRAPPHGAGFSTPRLPARGAQPLGACLAIRSLHAHWNFPLLRCAGGVLAACLAPQLWKLLTTKSARCGACLRSPACPPACSSACKLQNNNKNKQQHFQYPSQRPVLHVPRAVCLWAHPHPGLPVSPAGGRAAGRDGDPCCPPQLRCSSAAGCRRRRCWPSLSTHPCTLPHTLRSYFEDALVAWVCVAIEIGAPQIKPAALVGRGRAKRKGQRSAARRSPRPCTHFALALMHPVVRRLLRHHDCSQVLPGQLRPKEVGSMQQRGRAQA